MRKSVFILIALLSTTVSNAQQSVEERAAQAKAFTQALPADAPSREQALKFFDMLQVRRNMQVAIDGMKQQMKSGAEQGFRHKLPDATTEQVQQMQGMMDDAFSEISFDEVIDAMVPVYQKHRNVGLNEAIRLDLDRPDEMPIGDRNQRRHARRGQCTAGPLDIVRVLGPALGSHERDQPVEVGLCERFNRDLGHAASAARLVAQSRHRSPASEVIAASGRRGS